jgi:hypothetical protein
MMVGQKPDPTASVLPSSAPRFAFGPEHLLQLVRRRLWSSRMLLQRVATERRELLDELRSLRHGE